MISKNTAGKIAPGFRVGHLTVSADSGERKNGYIVWICVCDCGNTIRLDKRKLERGTVTDCGCMTKIRPGQRDVAGQRFGMLTAQYCTGKKDKSGAYIWHCLCDCGREADASLHQLQAGYRRSCGCLTRTVVKGRDSTSGHRGVYRQRKTGRWASQIFFQGKTYYLGAYDRIQDAVKVRERAEESDSEFLRWYYGEHLPALQATEVQSFTAGQDEPTGPVSMACPAAAQSKGN